MKLSELKIDSKAQRDGGWVDVPALPGVRIKTKSLASIESRLTIERKTRAARKALKIRGDVPVHVRDQILLETLHDVCLQDWEGIFGDDGAAVPCADNKHLILDPDFRPLADAVTWAASSVGSLEKDDLEEDAKNFVPPSAVN